MMRNDFDSCYILSELNFLALPYTSRNILTFYCSFARNSFILKSPIYVTCNNFNKVIFACNAKGLPSIAAIMF